MSEPTTPSNEATEIPFPPEEIRQFDADDAEAGRAIGKMLSLFFLYTTFVMAASTIATYIWVTSPSLK